MRNTDKPFIAFVATVAIIFFIMLLVSYAEIRNGLWNAPSWVGSLFGAFAAVVGAYKLDDRKLKREKRAEKEKNHNELVKVGTLLGFEMISYFRSTYYMLNRYDNIFIHLSRDNVDLSFEDNPTYRYFSFYDTDIVERYKMQAINFDKETMEAFIYYFSHIEKIISDGKFSRTANKPPTIKSVKRKIVQFDECNKSAKAAYALLKSHYAPGLPDIGRVMAHAQNLAIEDGLGAVPSNSKI